MPFYELLFKETAACRRNLYAVPQLESALQGKITRATYISYLMQAYHHVKHTVPLLMSMGGRLPAEKFWLHGAIAEYIKEEIGHDQWILNDIAAAGGDREAARMSTPHRETELLVAYNYDYISRKNPVGFLGMVFMLESTSVQIATQGAESVMRGLGLKKDAFSYLLSHGALDVNHLRSFETLVNNITDTADRAAIIEVAQNTFVLFADVLRSIPWQNEEVSHAA